VPVLTNKAANAATIATSTRPNTNMFSLAFAEHRPEVVVDHAGGDIGRASLRER
jgi:hypothetical protein